MADDLEALRDRIGKAVKGVEEKLKDLEAMKDQSLSDGIDVAISNEYRSWMDGIEERLGKIEEVISRLLKKFNV